MKTVLGKTGFMTFLVLFMLSVACGGDDKKAYPSAVVDNYMASCVDGGATQSQCRCTLDKLEDKYTLDEFLALESQLTEAGDLPPELISIIEQCLN